jgi:RNA polymerase II subunit A small phosphatase-like protein
MPRFDKLLVLDLDETLIHSVLNRDGLEFDFPVGPYAVRQRPGVREFMRRCLDWFTVGIWTTATEDYAAAVLDFICPDPDRLAFIWCRDRCTTVFDHETREMYFVKDLKKLRRRGYDIEKIIVVDDSPEVVSRNTGNAVIVAPYDGSALDDELPQLLRYLEYLGGVDNVRAVDKRGWRDRM